LAKAKRAILIGIDSVRPDHIQEDIRKGLLPNLKELVENGVFSQAFSTLPVLTPPAWTAIASGAWPGTSGVTGFQLHFDGDPLDKFHSAFDSRYCKAEFIWETAEKVGKRSILVNYPTSWPSKMSKGIQIAGWAEGVRTIGEFARFEYESPLIYSTSRDIRGAYIKLKSASGWQNVSLSHSSPLESKFTVANRDYDLLIIASTDENYDKVLICKGKDASKPVAELSEEEWSPWICERLKVESIEADGSYRFKLMKLSRNAEVLILFRTSINPTEGFCFPESLCREIVEKVGYFQERDASAFFLWRENSPYGVDSFYEESIYVTNWLADAALYAMKKIDWSLLFTYWIGPDHIYHLYAPAVDEANPEYDVREAGVAREWISKFLQLGDQWVGRILNGLETDLEDTVVIVMSDHGHIGGFKRIYLNNILAREGLLTVKMENGKPIIDWSKTKAAAFGHNYISVNLEGREPTGIVKNSEYEDVIDRVMRALNRLEDPNTGRSNLFIALTRDEGELLGLYGDRTGDIIYVTRPGYNCVTEVTQDLGVFKEHYFGQHTYFWPTVRGNRGFFIISGPSIKKKYLRSRPIQMVDVAPTICYLLDIPFSSECEGKVLYHIIE